MRVPARRSGKESSSNHTNNNSNNSCLNFLRDSEEGSAKGGSREEFWVGVVAPFVSHAACHGISLQNVPKSRTPESDHGTLHP